MIKIKPYALHHSVISADTALDFNSKSNRCKDANVGSPLILVKVMYLK